MSDTTLALLITIILLLTLAAWVPLLHTAETLVFRLTRCEKKTSTQEEAAFDTRNAA